MEIPLATTLLKWLLVFCEVVVRLVLLVLLVVMPDLLLMEPSNLSNSSWLSSRDKKFEFESLLSSFEVISCLMKLTNLRFPFCKKMRYCSRFSV